MPPQKGGAPRKAVVSDPFPRVTLTWKLNSDVMVKTTEMIAEAIRDSKHPFRGVADRPNKPTKHRYERRKARACLKGVDWDESPGST